MLMREAWKMKTRSLFNHNNNLVILLVLLQSLVNLHGLYCKWKLCNLALSTWYGHLHLVTEMDIVLFQASNDCNWIHKWSSSCKFTFHILVSFPMQQTILVCKNWRSYLFGRSLAFDLLSLVGRVEIISLILTGNWACIETLSHRMQFLMEYVVVVSLGDHFCNIDWTWISGKVYQK